MRSAPALPVSLGLTVLQEGLTKRAYPFGLLGPCPPDKLGVTNRAVGADVCSDGEIIYGANRGGLLRHLTRMLPHAKIFLRFARGGITTNRARYGRPIKSSLMCSAVNHFGLAEQKFFAAAHRAGIRAPGAPPKASARGRRRGRLAGIGQGIANGPLSV